MRRKWNKGPPPHVGWWNVGNGWWSWWDGKGWSLEVYESAKPGTVANWALEKVPVMREWSGYYPPGARVPRINPDAPLAAQKGTT